MRKQIFWLGAIISLGLPFISAVSNIASGLALLGGIMLVSFNLIDVPDNAPRWRRLSLNTAVVLFGFGLNIQKVIQVGKEGFLQTALSLIIVLVCGYLLFRLFKLDKKIGALIVFGTAICGGSAIAATAPLLDADEKEIGVSTGVVFLLNTVALFLFAFFASAFSLSAEQFGTWAALSIHDTSSVIGAAAAHSDAALQYATIMKLTRTLWIIPMVLVLASFHKGENKKISFPLFIVFFILASLISTFLPNPDIYAWLSTLGKSLLSLALYLVGCGLHIRTIKQVGVRSIAFGVVLWIISIISGFLITILPTLF